MAVTRKLVPARISEAAHVPLAHTPEPPYVAVIFTSLRSEDGTDYLETDAALLELVARQPGFLGVEAVDDETMGVSVSYWATQADARAWKGVADHLAAQRLGRERWYATEPHRRPRPR